MKTFHTTSLADQVFEKLEKDFPGGLTLHIRERIPAANVQVMGVMYLLDAEGMVLERL